MTFGKLARWSIENDWAKRIALGECIEIIKKCAENGQVQTGIPDHMVCNCCSHACINFVAMKLGKEHVYVANYFCSAADPETCISCGICAERYPVGAIEVDAVAAVDTTRCIGRGACATGCEEKTIRMVRRSAEEIARVDAEHMEAFGEMLPKSTLNWDLGGQ